MIEVEVKVDTSRFDRMLADFPVRMAQAQQRALWYIGQAVSSLAQQVTTNQLIR